MSISKKSAPAQGEQGAELTKKITHEISLHGFYFGIVPIAVTTSPNLEDFDVRLYAYLQWRAGRKGSSFPSLKKIADDLAKFRMVKPVSEGEQGAPEKPEAPAQGEQTLVKPSVGKIKRTLKRLIADDWILRLRRPNKSSLTLLFERREDKRAYEQKRKDLRSLGEITNDLTAIGGITGDLTEQGEGITGDPAEGITGDPYNYNKLTRGRKKGERKQPKRKKHASGGRQADPRTSSPEIVLFQEITGRLPHKKLYDLVIETMKGLADKGRMTKAELSPYYLAWLSASYNPHALTWLTEWAVEKRKGNTKRTAKQGAPAHPEQEAHASKLMENSR